MMLIHILENGRVIMRIHDKDFKWCVECVPYGALTVHRTHEGGIHIYRFRHQDKVLYIYSEADAVSYVCKIIHEFIGERKISIK